MTQQQERGHSSLKSSGTSPNFFSTTASENSPTFGSPARLNATARRLPLRPRRPLHDFHIRGDCARYDVRALEPPLSRASDAI